MKKSFPLVGLLLVGIVVGVMLSSRSRDAVRPSSVRAHAAEIGAAVSGETIYVPIYSSIHYDDSKSTLELAATLSIHNIDPERKIVLTKADYHDTAGALIEKYVEGPIVLNPLETKHLIIEKRNTAGGVGANFIVEWQADAEVSGPIVEALMVNAAHNLGIAFTSTGKVIKRTGAKR